MVPAVPAPLRQMVPQVMRLKLRARLLKVKPAMRRHLLYLHDIYLFTSSYSIPNLDSVPYGTHGGTEV